MNKKALVIFGATGSLATRKIFPSLKNLKEKNNTSFSGLEIIGYGRSDLDKKPFEDFKYIKGNLDDLTPLLKYLKLENIHQIFLYVSLPPKLYLSVLKSFYKYLKDLKIHIALEKPFGTSLENSQELEKTIKDFEFENIYLVDHFLAKQEVINFENISIKIEDITSLELSIFEEMGVEGRGEFFDEMGEIKDMGQNHLLNVLAKFVSPHSKLDFFENLKYKDGSLVLGQYEGYLNIKGVKKNSQTETLFKAELAYNDISIIFRSGKALNEERVSIDINYNNTEAYRIQIKPSENEITPPYEYILNDFLHGTYKFSLTISEAICAWRITEVILKDSKNVNLKVYESGSSFDKVEA